MTVKFMVLGAPRSGTTWAANWLNQQLPGECVLHDPFMNPTINTTVLDICKYAISCTSSVIQHPDWVLNHPCPKVILHRDFAEINRSLNKLGLPMVVPDFWDHALWAVRGLHVPWTDLFRYHTAVGIFAHLTGKLIKDRAGYEQLCAMNVQPSAKIIEELKSRVR